MTPTDTLPGNSGPDLDALCDAARSLAVQDAAGRRVDWDVVRRRSRRRRTLRLAAAAAAAAALVGGLGTAWLLAGPAAVTGDDAGSLQAGLPPAPQPTGYRILRPAERVYVVAEASARVHTASASELVLGSGVVWVQVDPSDGPLPFTVVTPDATVRVAGTRFAVAADASQGTRVATLDGHVVVRRDDQELHLYGGTQLEPDAAVPTPLGSAWRLSLEELLPEPNRPAAVATPDPAEAERPSTSPETDGTAADTSPPPAAAADAAERWYREAERALARGELDRAIALLQKVADAAPGSTRAGHALIDLGRAAQRAGKPAEAERAYERYLAQHRRGSLREDAWVAWCRLRARDGSAERLRACYSGYLAEFPTGAFAAEARDAVERAGTAAP
ncbi:MAG: FecR domain-containing protein [Deltaproteobacteria bacterium]|nr:FecR domain-containing protein [Deltaproteobacteria bacterium]